jgi:glycosyltransferase involved in cell wall biosynthesis
MQIGIDITPVMYNRGVSRYTSNLVRALADRKDASLHLFGYASRKKSRLQEFVKTVKTAQVELQSYPQSLIQWMWRFGFNPIKKSLPKIDIFHSWDWLQPPDKNLPLVSTIHDVAMLKFPETAHPKILSMHKHSWKILKERNAQIIAVSRATKKDIVDLIGIPSYNVHIVHEALPEEFRQKSIALSEEDAELIKQQLQLTKPFLLFVGTREPRKNLQRLIEAWLPLADQVELIIAGEKGWDETSKYTYKNLRFLGKVTDTQLAVLYGEAEMLCYPSLYEGFGLPILEAFFHGTPVVTSNLSSMPEVAGNAAELVDPNSVENIRQGIQTILNETDDQQKKRLQRMIIRLQMFTWERVAEETMAVYQKSLEQQA